MSNEGNEDDMTFMTEVKKEGREGVTKGGIMEKEQSQDGIVQSAIGKTESITNINGKAEDLKGKEGEIEKRNGTEKMDEKSEDDDSSLNRSSHFYTNSSTLDIETTVTTPVLLKDRSNSHDILVINQFDMDPSLIKDIHLSTSISSDPSIEIDLTQTDNTIHSTSVSCMTKEIGHLRVIRDIISPPSPPIITPSEEEDSISQSSEEAMFEEYWEEVVFHNYEEQIMRTQNKRLQLLKRIEETNILNAKNDKTGVLIGKRRTGRISLDWGESNIRTIDFPYLFDWKRADIRGGKITSIREEREEDVRQEEINESINLEMEEMMNEVSMGKYDDDIDSHHIQKADDFKEEREKILRKEKILEEMKMTKKEDEEIILTKLCMEKTGITEDKTLLKYEEKGDEIGETSEEMIIDCYDDHPIMDSRQVQVTLEGKCEVNMKNEQVYSMEIVKNLISTEMMKNEEIKKTENEDVCADRNEIYCKSTGMDDTKIYAEDEEESDETCEEAKCDIMEIRYDGMNNEENIYEEICDYINKRINIEDREIIGSVETTSIAAINLTKEKKFCREDSERDRNVMEKKNSEIDRSKMIEVIDIMDNIIPFTLSRDFSSSSGQKGKFVEMMAHEWNARLTREEERRMSPKRIEAPRRKDFQANDYVTDVMEDEVINRPHDLNILSISARPSIPVSSFLHHTPSITIPCVAERSEEYEMDSHDFHIGDVTVITNDGVHIKERNAYYRNEYESVKAEVAVSPELERESRRTLKSIRVASKSNRWGEPAEHSMRLIERYHSLDRDSSSSSPHLLPTSINSSNSHSLKKSVTFASHNKLFDYRNMHEYTVREEYGSTEVEGMDKQNGVLLIEAEDSFTRKETSNGQSITRHYERNEKREPVNGLPPYSRDSLLTYSPDCENNTNSNTVERVFDNRSHRLSPPYNDNSSPSTNVDNTKKFANKKNCIDRHCTVSKSDHSIESCLSLSTENTVKKAELISQSCNLSLSHYNSFSLRPYDSSKFRPSSQLNLSLDTQTNEMRDQNEDIQLNGNATIQVDDKGIPSSLSSHWDPTLLIRKLYEVTYEPRMETKRCRFINMEGHIEVPNEEFEEGFERKWVPKYVKTRDGRLQFFVTHYADETPAEEKLLSGAEVEVLRDERILRILGGRAHLKISLRVPSALIDKWRQALLSHAASSSIDAYIRPIPSAIPHNNQRVLIIELGCCSMRGGILTSEPSLPSSFFPSIAAILPNGNIIVGEEAYLPQNRLGGRLAAPLTVSDSLETYSINKDVLRASILKIVNDSKLDPKDYKALVSLSQNIPSVLIEDIMKILLEDIHFQAAAVTRQPSLVLYAYDVSTGVVVDIGDKLSIIPVVDGYMVESGIVSLPHGGKQMQNCMRRQLAHSNQGVYGHDNIIDSLLLRNVMEETSFVSQDAQEESVNCKSVTISLSPYNPISTMPSSLTIDKSRFMAIEGLFTPNKWNIEGKGLHQLIHESIQNSPIDARRVLYRNIYLAGGASLIPGLAERLESELANIVPSTIHSQVHISPWRSNAAFLGAQVVASASSFDQSCITLSSLPSFLHNLRTSPF